MRLFTFLLLLIGIYFKAPAQTWVNSARYYSLGDVRAISQDASSAFNNPAGLGKINSFQIGVNANNYYFIRGVNSGGFYAVIPRKNSAIGLSYNVLQFSSYLKSSSSVSYGLNLSETFQVGVRFKYDAEQFQWMYPNSSALSADIGFQAIIRKKIILATLVENMARVHIKEKNLNNNARFSIGLNWLVSDKVMIPIELQKNGSFPLNSKCGVEYLPYKDIAFRVGISTNPTKFYFGAGFKYKKAKIDLSNSIHPALGIQPGISILFDFKKNP